jgi:hypothetical protein
MGHWALGMGHWAWGIGHWALGIGDGVWGMGRLLTLPHVLGRLFNNAHCLRRGIKCGGEVYCRFL